MYFNLYSIFNFSGISNLTSTSLKGNAISIPSASQHLRSLYTKKAYEHMTNSLPKLSVYMGVGNPESYVGTLDYTSVLYICVPRKNVLIQILFNSNMKFSFPSFGFVLYICDSYD